MLESELSIPKFGCIIGYNTYSACRFDLIDSCWKENPDKRPTFSELVVSITSMLEAISGYFDFCAQPDVSGKNTSYDHLNRYDQLKPTSDKT